MIHPLLKKAVMSDIILLKLVGINIVWCMAAAPKSAACWSVWISPPDL